MHVCPSPRSSPIRRRLRAVAAVCCALLMTGMLTTCTTNPATGKSQLNVLSKEEEIEIGKEAAPEFLKEGGGPIPDPEIQRYVADLGARLAEVSERPDLPWEFYTLDSSVINAFALPGGKVFISRGLMAKMDNEAQLAGVLGHEVGHVTAKHINDRLVQAAGVQVLATAVGVAGAVTEEEWLSYLGLGVVAGGQLFTLSFSRDQELEADRLGVRYMTRLNYDPLGQLQVMHILKDASGGGGIEFLQTHPLPGTRIDRLDALIRQEHPSAGDRGAYAFHQERFHERVLDRLAQLPPPEDQKRGSQSRLTPELLERYGVITCGSGCAHVAHRHAAHEHEHEHDAAPAAEEQAAEALLSVGHRRGG